MFFAVLIFSLKFSFRDVVAADTFAAAAAAFAAVTVDSVAFAASVLFRIQRKCYLNANKAGEPK